MTPASILGYLRQLCHDLDHGGPVGPAIARTVGTVAIPAAIALGGASGCCADYAQDVYGAPFEDTPREVCDDGIDNNSNGLVDMADPACADFVEPTPTVYGVPMPEDQPTPVPPDPSLNVPAYGAPFPGPEGQQPTPQEQPDQNPPQNFPVPPYAAPFQQEPQATPPQSPDLPPASGAYAAPFPNDAPLM
jgi:hypothetical protein